MKHLTRLNLPADGKWLVTWGGDTEKHNIHHSIPVQRYAFDLVGTDENGKSYKNKGLKNEDYYVFGQPILAPADGIIIEAVTGIRDNLPNQTNPFVSGGNYILLKHTAKEYSFIAHLRLGSTLVKAGDKVKLGQKLGECGNTGNSSEPHIHYHLQDSEVHTVFHKAKAKPNAKGIKVYFSHIGVEKNNVHASKELYSPVQGDVVYNINNASPTY